MSQPPLLTDQIALTRNRRRAAAAPALFLQQAMADEVQERLIEVNRTFRNPAIVTGWPDLWADTLPEAKIIADQDVLDLQSGAHDLVIHALALHWANDPIGQLIQCARALKPDGLLIATLFGGQTLNELRSALAQAESELTGGLSPRVVPMADIRDLGALLQRAGLNLPVADSNPITVTYADPIALMQDLRAMGENNALHGRLRQPTRRDVFLKASQIYHAQHAHQDGRIPATFEIVTLTGWAPDDSQPKPLRPGSASQRLADALSTQEHPLDPSEH
ncbi:methyltransferase domain-containing protein [Aestuariibius sp. HNIBRBA575]|uniref:methyltransferase domain-containing protein n=1 Tax=Aestuariibius sp. HNIBRBA575 TaxID=3233343 RepID=UPI0034A390A1